LDESDFSKNFKKISIKILGYPGVKKYFKAIHLIEDVILRYSNVFFKKFFILRILRIFRIFRIFFKFLR